MTLGRFDLPAAGLPAARLCLAQRVPAGDPEQLRAATRRSSAFAADLRRSAEVLLCGGSSQPCGAARRTGRWPNSSARTRRH